MSDAPTLNVDEALGFLRKWPAAYVHLVAIKVDPATHEKVKQEDGGIVGQTFTKDDLDDDGPVDKWLQQYSGQANLYYTVNSVARPGKGKPGKKDIARVDALHIDVDVEAGAADQETAANDLVAKLKDFPIEPSVIVYSGGGAQAFWLLKPPLVLDGTIESAQEAERYTRWLEGAVHEALGTKADATHNVDRIMRLPGTINVADVKKLKKGRHDSQARLVLYNDTRTYPIDTFQLAARKGEEGAAPRVSGKPGGGAESSVVEQPLTGLDDPRLKDVPADVMETIRTGKRIGAPAKDDPHFHVCCQMVRAGCSAFVIKEAYKLGHISDGSDGWPRRFEPEMNRVIRRAVDAVRDEDLDAMNQRHAVINISGKTKVLTWMKSTEYKGQFDAVFSSFDDFKNLHNNKSKQIISQDAKGNQRLQNIPIGSWWIGNAHRRQYDGGFKFMPWTFEEEVDDTLNIFRGFAVPAAPTGDTSKFALFMEHLLVNVCCGVQEYFDYLIRWFAFIIQFRKRTDITVLLRSDQEGTGKGIVGQIFSRLLGPHGMQVTQSQQVVGNFNSHLENLLFVHADEAFFAGDPRHRNVLWSLITEPMLAVERKGVDIYRAVNYLNVLITTNSKHAVEVVATARRVFALTVGVGRLQDTEYFEAMLAEMKDGGYSALLKYLQDMDLTGFNVRNCPKTAALDEQKSYSRKGVDAIVEDVCHTGALPYQHHSRENCTSTYGERSNEGFWAWCKANAPDLKRDAPSVLAKQFKAWGVQPWTSGHRFMVFPELAALRKAFDLKHGAQDWSDGPDVWQKTHGVATGGGPASGGPAKAEDSPASSQSGIPF